MIGLGIVWVGLGAGIAVFFAVVGPAGDVRRGLYLIMLGVVTLVAGFVWSRRTKRRRGTKRDV